MRLTIFLLFILTAASRISAQTPGTPVESTTYMVRESVFGKMVPLPDVRVYAFGANDLAVLQNGYVITMEELMYTFNQTERSDTSSKAKKLYLDQYVSSTQRIAEAMAQGLDTSSAFKIEFLKRKQTFITKYLNEGKTRIEAEALPEVKYHLRAEYRGMLLFELMNREVWSKGTDENLRSFYYDHLSLYQGQSFETSRTKVVYDFHKQKESELDTRAQERFPVMTNAALVAKL